MEAPPTDVIAAAAIEWQAAYDHASQAWYYYNTATRERSWDPPPGWVAAQENEATTAAVADGSGPKAAGYFYVDAHGTMQGPFSEEQLRAWRGHLPMDLQVWWQEEEAAAVESEGWGKEEKEGAAVEEGKQQEESSSGGAAKTRVGGEEEEEQDASNATTPAAEIERQQERLAEGSLPQPLHRRRETKDLSEVLGDAELLAQWRSEQDPSCPAAVGCLAPPAAVYEADKKKDSFTSLAEAALAGLPAHDEAVQLAAAAATAGKSIHEAAEWGRREYMDYTATAMHAAGVGRLQSADGAREGLYADMGSWVDPRTMEAQLAKAKEREKRGLSAADVKKLKKHKQEMKEKKMKAWLLE